MIILRLSDGIKFQVYLELEAFADAFQHALKKKELLFISNDEGQTRVVNPQQVLYFEEEHK